MPQRRFITLFVLVSAAVTGALLLGRAAAARDGDGTLTVAAGLAGVVAVLGIVILGRVVVVVERARRLR
ncbi:MAG: hypothetical protein ABI611_09080 [Solirubrobacteraceae bacterium]